MIRKRALVSPIRAREAQLANQRRAAALAALLANRGAWLNFLQSIRLAGAPEMARLIAS